MEASYGTGERNGGRWIGLQANASSLSPEELEGSDRLLGDGPGALAEGIVAAARRWGLRIVGGCCGTDARLIEALGTAVVRRSD